MDKKERSRCFVLFDGGPGGDRRVRAFCLALPSARERPLLCGGQSNPCAFGAVFGRGTKLAKIENRPTAVFFFGGPGGDRTHDLSVANAALSQLSYEPIRFCTTYYTIKKSSVKGFLKNKGGIKRGDAL